MAIDQCWQGTAASAGAGAAGTAASAGAGAGVGSEAFCLLKLPLSVLHAALVETKITSYSDLVIGYEAGNFFIIVNTPFR